MFVRLIASHRAGEIVEMPDKVALQAIANGTAERVEEVLEGSLETTEMVPPETAMLETGRKRVASRRRQ